MKLFKLFVVTALAVFCSTLDAKATQAVALQPYVTTDPNVAAIKPPPPGTPVNPWGAQTGAVTIQPGTTVWLAFLNTPDDAKRKYFRLEMTAPAGGLGLLTIPVAEGFSGDDDSSPVATHFVSNSPHSTSAVHEYRFSPQPAWERLSFTNPAGNPPVVVTSVLAGSACAYSRPDTLSPKSLKLVTASIGSATPGAMIGTPHINAIWIFPASIPVDPMAAQPFSAPPASGSWQHGVVFQTPFGDPRPLGGVLWRTLGSGLLPDEDFSLVLTMLNSADTHYEFFAIDAGTQQALSLSLDLTNLEPISYCVAKTNSLGCVPAIGSQGMPSASAQGGFFVTCSQMRNNKPGVMLYSVQGRASNPFQGGFLCVQAPIRRTIGMGSGGNPGPGSDCSGVFAIDMNAFAAGLLGGNPAPELSQPGRTVDCQWWSRDPQAQFGSSLSNALEYVVGN